MVVGSDTHDLDEHAIAFDAIINAELVVQSRRSMALPFPKQRSRQHDDEHRLDASPAWSYTSQAPI
jgi:hypothetical protein